MESSSNQAILSLAGADPTTTTPLLLIPIATLDGGDSLSTRSHCAIQAVVTLIWPYSSSTTTTSILAVDPDFRLRNKKGQVRIQFRGHAGKALGASGLAIGDSITLNLAGARYALNEASSAVQTPGRSVDGELIFTRRLDVNISRRGVSVADIHVDEPASPAIDATPARPSRIEYEPALLQTPARIAQSPAVWSSPAFATPARNYALAPNRLGNDFDDGFTEGRSSKRLKSWGTPGKWHLAGDQAHALPDEDYHADDDDDDDEDEDIGLPSSQVSHVPISAELVQSMQPPPLPRISVRPSIQIDSVPLPSPTRTLLQPTSPRLRPVQSPGLPLISPFPFEVPTLAGGSVQMGLEHQSGYFDVNENLEPHEQMDAVAPELLVEHAAGEDDLYSASPRLSFLSPEQLEYSSQIPDSSVPENDPVVSLDEQEYLEFVDASGLQHVEETEHFERQSAVMGHMEGTTSLIAAENNQMGENKQTLEANDDTGDNHQVQSRELLDHPPEQQRSDFEELLDSHDHDNVEEPADMAIINMDGTTEDYIAPPTGLLPFTPPASQEHPISALQQQTELVQIGNGVERPLTPLLTQQSSKIDRASPPPPPVQDVIIPGQDEQQVTPAIDLQLTYPRPSKSVEGRNPDTGLRTSLSYYTPLATIQSHMNIPPTLIKEEAVDVLSVVTADVPDPIRAASGPKDFFTMMHIIDPSSPASTTLVQVFRPYKFPLPRASRGDVVLLRGFLVYRTSPRLVSLLSTESSAWLVWRFARYAAEAAADGGVDGPIWAQITKKNPPSDLEECRGPPVEFGAEEEGRAVALRHWWLSLPEDLRPKVKAVDTEPKAALVAKDNISVQSSQIIEPAAS